MTCDDCLGGIDWENRARRTEAERDGAVQYVGETLVRLAAVAGVPIEDDDGPRANFYLVDDIALRIEALKRSVVALIDVQADA